MNARTESTLYQILIFLNSVLLSVGLARVFLSTNAIRAGLMSVLLPVLMVHVLFRLFLKPPIRAMITLSVLILAAILAFLFIPDQMAQLRDELFDLSGKVVYTAEYFTGFAAADNRLIPFASTAVIVLISFLVCLTTARIQLPLLWAIALLSMMTLNAIRAVKQDTLGILLASFPILILMVRRQPFRRDDRRRPLKRQSVTAMMVASPLIVLAMAGSVILTPLLPVQIGRQQQLLEGLADDLSQQLGFQPATELQPDFSISFAGFYPLGTRLGGPVTLGTSPVMDVKGHDGSMLLRGAIYDRYTGRNWQRDPRGETYRLDNVFQKDLKETVFDLDQPDPDVVSGGVVNGLVGDSTLTIAPRTITSGMIFTQGRPVSINPQTNERFQVYFDDHGMLYSKYPLTTRSVYDVEAKVLLTGSKDFSYYTNLVSGLGSATRVPREAYYAEDYLTVPRSIYYRQNGMLKTLADRLTQGLEDPYAKALAIRRYLIENATYNLNVAVPPADQDFVIWFLQTREGYCVYFATAEVMLCRLAGIPARYVEGFILDPPGQLNGTTTVTADRAHAWCEIYVPLIGWIPVDATPGATVPGEDATEPEPEPTNTDPDSTTVDTSETTEEIVNPDEPDQDVESVSLLARLLMTFLVGGLIALVVLTIRNRIHILRYPEKLKRLYPDPKLRADIYWQELQLLFRDEGLVVRDGETSIRFLQRVAEKWPGRAGRLTDTGRILSAVRYGRHEPRETELALLSSLLIQIEEECRESRLIRHFLLRVLMPHLRGVDRRRRIIRDHALRAFVARLRFVQGT